MSNPAMAAFFVIVILCIIGFTLVKNHKEKRRLEKKLMEDDKEHWRETRRRTDDRV